MITKIFRVMACSEASTYKTTNGNESKKRQILLQEHGGYNNKDSESQKVSNCLVCTVFGNLAQCSLQKNELVVASLRFAARYYEGQWYQDITITDINKINNNIF